MSILNRLRHALDRAKMSEFIPAIGYDDDRRIFALRREAAKLESPVMDIGAAWYGVPSSGLDNQMVSDMEELMRQDFPPNTLMQIQRVATTQVNATINDFHRQKRLSLLADAGGRLTGEQRNILLGQAEARANYLHEGTQKPLIAGTGHKIKEELVFVSVRIPSRTRPNPAYLDRMQKLLDRVESQLEKINIRPKRMTPQSYINAVHGILRIYDKTTPPQYSPDQPINTQVAHSEDRIRAHKEYCRVNDAYVASMSAHSYPTEHHLRNMLTLFGDVMGASRQLNEPYMATLNIIFPDHLRAKDRYVANKSWVENFTSKGTLHTKFPRLRYKKEQFDIMEKAVGMDGVFLDIWFNFQTLAPSAEIANDELQNFRSISRGFGWDFRADTRVHALAFLQSLPLCATPALRGDMARHQMKAGLHAAHVSPVIGEWAGNSASPVQLYISRRGALQSLNSWESSTGYNGIVSASTGAGKSFFIQDFALNNLAHGVKVSLIDKGRSFIKMVEELEGEYFDFIEPGAYNLNPYLQVRDIDEETEQLAMIFQTMADPTAGLDNYQRPRLTSIIREGWAEHGSECTVDWVAKRCLADEDRRVKDMGEMLAGFCKDGQHGAWFNSGAPLTFDRNMLTAIELSGLDNKPGLQAVVLQMVLMELQRIMYTEDLEGTGLRSMTIVDEAADLLQLKGPSDFAERMARQARKYQSAVWVVTQLLSDFRGRIPSGEAILGNTAFKILLNQKQEVIRELQTENWAGLSEYEIALLETVHTQPGRYSEALFITPGGSGVGRLVLPRQAQLLYTTDPGEKTALARLKAQGLSTAEAIEALVESEKQGAVGAEDGLQQRKTA